MKSPRLLLAPVSAFLLFAALVLAPESHAQEPDIRAQVQTWEAALTAASPLNNPAAMIAQANATNPTPSNRGDLLGAVAAAAATKARLYQWYGTPAYLTGAKTYFMAIVNGFTTTSDISFFAPTP
jgi:hypothetical protein